MTLRAMNVFKWAEVATPGRVLVYHTGPFLPAGDNDNADEERDVVFAVRYLYNQGLVELTQKRLGKGLFEYRATKRKRTRTPHHKSRFHVPERIVDIRLAMDPPTRDRWTAGGRASCRWTPRQGRFAA